MTERTIDLRLVNMQNVLKVVNDALADAGMPEPPQADEPDVVISCDPMLLYSVLEDCLEWDITRTDDGVQPVRAAALLTKRIVADVTDCEDLPGPAGRCWACDLSDVVGAYERDVRFSLTDLRWVDAGDGKHRRAIATFSVQADGE